MNLLFYLAAFGLALGILIVVHEYGHYLVARLCGIKVLRFCVGFGRPLWSRRFGPDGTEWAIAAFPLGGYVKMLDEREGAVAAEERSRAFNTQPVLRRMAVVVAGPLANFLLAIGLYWGLNLYGVEELRPLLARPAAGTVAEAAGVQERELVRSVDGKPVATWIDLRWIILDRALAGASVNLEVENAHGDIAFRRIDLSRVDANDLDTDLMGRIGLSLYRPAVPAIIASLTPGGVAEAAGLREGDRITAIDGIAIDSWFALVTTVRAIPGKTVSLEYERATVGSVVRIIPDTVEEGGKRIGRIGVGVKTDPDARRELVTTVRYGPLAALSKALQLTWDTSAVSLAMLGRMVLGQVSWKNLSGPVTIADYAGQSARLGLAHYIKFLALISISLGVLNLLPIPVLDGGHLMYYVIELVKGGPVSERALEIGQQIGLGLLVMLMAFAFYNDFNRLFSG